MAGRLILFVARVRERKSGFFVKRLRGRLKFDPARLDVPDSPENLVAVLDACRALGYEPPPEELP
jgi:hypothetical protein